MNKCISFILVFSAFTCSIALAEPPHAHVYNNGGHGYHHDHDWYGGGAVIINNAPDDYWYNDGLYDDDDYYDPTCQTIQNCNPDGECVTQQYCD